MTESKPVGAGQKIQEFPWKIFFLALLVMGLSFGFFFLLQNAVRGPFKLSDATELAEGISSYITVIGVIYALMVGFTFQQSIERQRDLRTSMHREAGCLSNIILLTEVMQDGEAMEAIMYPILDFLDASKKIEGVCEGVGYSPALQELYRIVPKLNDVASDGVEDDVDRVTLRAIHEELREVSRANGDRMAICANRLPQTQWFSLQFLASLLLLGFFFLDLSAPILEGLLFALVCGSVTVLMAVMYDLDNPLGGVWRVDSSIMETLHRELKAVKYNSNDGKRN